MSRLLYAAALSSSILLSPAHAQSPFTPAPLGEDILQKARDWQAAPNPKPPTEFRAGHVTPRKLDKDALQAKPGGFEVTLPSGAPVTTPTVYDGKVFSSGGFHSKEFYAVDAKTGQLVWGLDLDDDGPSSAACDAGRCAFNTESCTLFVVDANTGKQVWSLWLGDPLTSAPAIADGRVYTSYPARGHLSASHVLAAFDLQTGTILWQRWIDSDVQSAPVVAEGKDGDKVGLPRFVPGSWDRPEGVLRAQLRPAHPRNLAPALPGEQQNADEAREGHAVLSRGPQLAQLAVVQNAGPLARAGPDHSPDKRGAPIVSSRLVPVQGGAEVGERPVRHHRPGPDRYSVEHDRDLASAQISNSRCAKCRNDMALKGGALSG